MKKIRTIIVGCGNRGADAYGRILKTMPDKYEVTAVVDPIDDKRNAMKNQFQLSEEMCFRDWKDAAALPKFADLIILSMQDKMHHIPALAFIDQKYDLLLEKPIAPSPQECMDIVRAVRENNTKILVCHVLRYTQFYTTLKKMLNDGIIGKIIVINHTEGVGNVHQSHSFVRGNWSNSDQSSPMILAKSCHDADLLQWLVGGKCKKLQSFGTLSHFTRENAPTDAPDRCTDGCKYMDSCYYNAVKLYYDDKKNDWFRNVAARKPNPTDEEIMEALKHGPYGRCVYKCDNNVVDHQTINMEFEDHQTVTFTMSAFTEGGRRTRIMGTKGELTADMEKGLIDVYTFSDRSHHLHTVETPKDGHGGGDIEILLALHEYLNGVYKGFSICDIETSALNHLICFAAEESRLNNGKTIDMEEYQKLFTE